MKKKILIVGGTGFIGYHLAKKCLSKNWEVTSFSTRKPKSYRYLKKEKYLIGDISSFKDIKKKIKKRFHFVVNLGGHIDHLDKKKVFQSHLIGCKNLANFFLKKNIKAFIQMGSSNEYGKLKSPHKENLSGNPLSPYGRAKLQASRFLLDLFKKKKFPVIVLRLYQAYGPKQETNRLIPILIVNSLKDNIYPCSEGKQFRDFIYVEDVVSAIFKCFSKSKKVLSGQILNLGTGKPIKIKKIIKMITFKVKKGKPQYGKIKMRKDEAMKIYPSIRKVSKILKWKPKISFSEGLTKTYNSYKRDYKNY